MNPIEVLLMCWAAGLVLERKDDAIVIRGITPETPRELLELIRENKPKLLAFMTDATARAS